MPYRPGRKKANAAHLEAYGIKDTAGVKLWIQELDLSKIADGETIRQT